MNFPTVAMPKISIAPDVGRYSGIATPVAAIIVSILVSVFVTWPKFSEVLKLKDANQELAVRFSSLNEKAGVLESISSDKEKLELMLAQSEQLLPSEKNVFSFIQQVEGASRSSGVLLSRLEVSPGAISGADKTTPAAPAPAAPGQATTTPELAPKISLKLALTSDYRSFLQFVDNVLTFSRIASVGDLSLAASSSSGESYQLRTSLTVNGFWQPLPGDLASVESPIDVLTSQEEELLSKVQFTSTTIVSTPTSGGEASTIPTGKTDIFAPF